MNVYVIYSSMAWEGCSDPLMATASEKRAQEIVKELEEWKERRVYGEGPPYGLAIGWNDRIHYIELEVYT